MAATKKKLSSLNDDDFMKEWDKAGKEFQAAKDRVQEFAQEHDRRETAAALDRQLAGVSDENLAQYVEARGIKSGEKVNGA